MLQLVGFCLSSGERIASLEDVQWLYKLFLGRVPTERDWLDVRVGRDLDGQVKEVFQSSEFLGNVVRPIKEDRLPNHDRIDFQPEGAEWVCARLHLEEASHEAILAANTWVAFYDALLRDPLFPKTYELDQKVYDVGFLATLRVMVDHPEYYRRIGHIDDISTGGLRGWAIDPEAPDQAISVELWLDDHFVGATDTELFRRDIQDRYNGEGKVGFFIEYSRGWPQGRPYVLELKDRASGKVLSRLERAGEARRAERPLGLKEDLANVRRLLTSIEQRLKDEELSSANQLERYDLYYDQIYRGRDLGHGLPKGDLRVHLIMELGKASHIEIEKAFLSLVRSASLVSGQFTVVTKDAAHRNVLRDLVARLSWAGQSEPLPAVEAFSCATMTEAVKRTQGSEVVVFAPAIGFLAEGALAVLLAPFVRPEIKMAYGDDDALAPGDFGLASERHIDPRLKPGYDPDLLIQIPYLGPCLAVRSEVLAELEAGRVDMGLGLQALSLAQGLCADNIAHVARVIFTRFTAEVCEHQAKLWRSYVDPLLEDGQSIEPWSDILGVDLPHASRVRRPITSGTTKAAIIIPTKNGLNLLKPCVDSLLRSLPHNQTEAEVIIINHQSDDAETLNYMAQLSEGGRARIIDYEGPFNWALMNNLGAQATEADVLVCLNNDTLIISPDWLDCLSAQALRPEVGVVGARLLYQNGSIQHAGFVWREHHPGFLVHEGVGVPGHEGGYLGRHALTHATVAVTGACLAIASETFKALGGFDAANFPVECNDVDLCLRAWDHGYRVLYEPAATLYHLESVSRGYNREAEQLKVANAANSVLLDRWGPIDRCDPFFNAHFSREGWPFDRLRPPH